MKHPKLTLIAALLTTAATAAPLPVVTSFSILGDVAKQIGGERVPIQTWSAPTKIRTPII